MVPAGTLRSAFVSLAPFSPTTTTTTTTFFRVPVLCGPRDNRGPLVKGRILSTEAIHAIQSLKRAHRLNPNNPSSLPSLSRLLKPDLLAALRELLRQDHCALALHVLSTFRSEFPQCTPDLVLYADVASALARNQMYDDIDRLISDLEKDEGGVRWGEDRALVRLVKILIGTRRSESTVKIYWMMKRSGCGVEWEADEYLAKVLAKGLRRMGSADLAEEVDNEFCRVVRGNFGEMRRAMRDCNPGQLLRMGSGGTYLPSSPPEDTRVYFYQRLLPLWQSRSLARQQYQFGYLSWDYQFDAARLDVEMSAMLKGQLLRSSLG